MSDDLGSAATAAQDRVDPQELAVPDEKLQERIVRDREEYRASRKLS